MKVSLFIPAMAKLTATLCLNPHVLINNFDQSCSPLDGVSPCRQEFPFKMVFFLGSQVSLLAISEIRLL